MDMQVVHAEERVKKKSKCPEDQGRGNRCPAAGTAADLAERGRSSLQLLRHPVDPKELDRPQAQGVHDWHHVKSGAIAMQAAGSQMEALADATSVPARSLLAL